MSDGGAGCRTAAAAAPATPPPVVLIVEQVARQPWYDAVGTGGPVAKVPRATPPRPQSLLVVFIIERFVVVEQFAR